MKRPLLERFMARVTPEPNTGCWLWTGNCDAFGYGRLCPHRAHRLALQLSGVEVQDGVDVLHRCDVPGCVNPDHLFLGTAADNKRDEMKKLRHNFGERNGRRRLTIEQVRRARALVLSGVQQKAVAAELGVHPSTVSYICSGSRWSLALEVSP